MYERIEMRCWVNVCEGTVSDGECIGGFWRSGGGEKDERVLKGCA